MAMVILPLVTERVTRQLVLAMVTLPLVTVTVRAGWGWAKES
jgi:hypothetical protein